MKTLWRWAFRLLILLIVLVVAGVLLLDPITREIIKYQIRKRTGLEAKIGRLSIGLFSPTITAENVVLYNSAEFGGSPLFEMPELFIEYDRAALRSNQAPFQTHPPQPRAFRRGRGQGRAVEPGRDVEAQVKIRRA